MSSAGEILIEDLYTEKDSVPNAGFLFHFYCIWRGGGGGVRRAFVFFDYCLLVGFRNY